MITHASNAFFRRKSILRCMETIKVVCIFTRNVFERSFYSISRTVISCVPGLIADGVIHASVSLGACSQLSLYSLLASIQSIFRANSLKSQLVFIQSIFPHSLDRITISLLFLIVTHIFALIRTHERHSDDFPLKQTQTTLSYM